MTCFFQLLDIVLNYPHILITSFVDFTFTVHTIFQIIHIEESSGIHQISETFFHFHGYNVQIIIENSGLFAELSLRAYSASKTKKDAATELGLLA